MQEGLQKLVFDWATAEPDEVSAVQNFYCQTRDVFQARLDKMVQDLLLSSKLAEEDVYILSAITGEIGNNSFDHNLGNWPDIPGTFFAYDWEDNKFVIVLADRGRGIFTTLTKVRPEMKDDKDALRIAFTEKISGRAPESRGNGLKFVKENVILRNYHLQFISGKAEALSNDRMKITWTERPISGTLAIIEMRYES